jgi:hypothetical protein
LKKHLTWVILALILGGLAFWASKTRLALLANLRVPQNTFPDVYLHMDVGSTTKCLVSGRSGTTEKRSDKGLAKASWRCRLETTPGKAPVFVANSKQRPSYLFAPLTAVSDLAYPLVYEEVRAGETLDLPDMHWVHLYYNRQFQGLYLEISTPGRHFAAQRMGADLTRTDLTRTAIPLPLPRGRHPEPKGPAKLEFLAVKGSALVCFDRKMRPVCPVYNLAVADGIFPRPKIVPAISLLEWLSPPPAFTFILSNHSNDLLEPFPIPVNLGELLERKPYVDQRYRRWQKPGPPPEHLEEQYARLFAAQSERTENHLQDLAEAIRASCVVMGCNAAEQIERLAAGATGRWLMDS